ncbi:hypothetical protein [Hymenobacter rigui]|uniref:Uncharacterized protein n=1 Tax=Hymenobacter rigui TaxID=334424 RepID=A0A3R9NN44_9BACT|nr:hypothetical protein [Hymenobacter rigui]RSK50889.1 hypothetical protein EI291_00805 [Hymenobacter rigui]
MRYLLFSLLLALAATPAWAQLEATSPAQQRAANRKALRDAEKFNAKYKDSHLTVTKAELKHQGGGKQEVLAPPPGQASYRFDRDGTPRVSEPSRINLRLRKKRDAAGAQ